MKNKTCVVIGGAGFIGHHLVRKLLDSGANVKIVDDLSSGSMKRVPSGVMFFKLDISLPNATTALEAIMQGADYVFHLAAKISVPESIENPVDYHKTNVDGTQAVLEAARRTHVQKVVFSSSSAVYGDVEHTPSLESDKINPKSPYALHKAYGEMLCEYYSKNYSLKTVALRYFNVYGLGHRTKGAYAPVVALFAKQFHDKELLTVCGDGSQTRDFIHVSDIVEANVKAAVSEFTGSGESINIGSGEATSILRLAEMFGSEIKHLEPRVEPAHSRADISKAKKLLNWSPTISIDEGVKQFILYERAFYY